MDSDLVHLRMRSNWKYLLNPPPNPPLTRNDFLTEIKLMKIKGSEKWKQECEKSWWHSFVFPERISSRNTQIKGRLIDKWKGLLYAGNKSAKNHDGFLGNGGQHVIVVTFKTSKRSWATAGQNQNSIVEFLDLFLNEFCMFFSFYVFVVTFKTSEIFKRNPIPHLTRTMKQKVLH